MGNALPETSFVRPSASESQACYHLPHQARAPLEEGELCISAAGVELLPVADRKGVHTLLPKGCAAKGLRHAPVKHH